MPSKRPFYRNLLTIEILSEEPLRGDFNLYQMAYLITEGSCSGKVETSIAVDSKKMAQLLRAQDTEPAYFGLDDNGNDLYEAEDDQESDNTEH